jgi:hypothetical protein
VWSLACCEADPLGGHHRRGPLDCDKNLHLDLGEPMNSLSPLAQASIISALLLLIVAFWVPIDYSYPGQYYDANLFKEIAPRALLGGIANIFHFTPWAYITIRVGFQALWLFLIVLDITKQLRQKQYNRGYYIFEVAVLGFLFCFNAVIYNNQGRSEFVDVVPYTLILCAIPLLIPRDQTYTVTRHLAATILLVLAVLIHEKSIFDIAILAVWATWKYGLNRSARLMLPSVLASLCFLWTVRNKAANYDMSPQDYINITGREFSFLLNESLNIWGIIFAGGALWVVFSLFAYNLIRIGGFKCFIAIAMMALLCLAPLMVAHDTIRMVGVIWLPTYLLLRETDLRPLLESIQFRKWAPAACLLQLLIPPVLMYQDGVVPYNCYSKWLIEHSLPTQEQVATSGVTPFGLYALRREDISSAIVCGAPRLIRGESTP